MIKIIKQLAPKQNHYFLAVSMGVDSVSALLWLRSKGYNITPLHFNHNLRSQNGTMQERFFELCDFLGLEGKTDIGIGLKTEVDCRTARLDFYSRVAQNGTIITAHHRNDWVENYLLNCLRGHPSHNPFELTSYFENFKVIHPFLLTRKIDLKQYLERNGWMRFVVEDESNSQIKGSRRNWVRNAIIPQMQQQKLSLEKYAKRKINSLLKKESQK
jgi:tRNA(Ile)-lysidine synthetase-like protein